MDVLKEDVRTIVTKTILPKGGFYLMKQDIVKEALGDEAFVNACEEGTCVGDLVKKVQANFGARCDIYTVNKQLYLKFELYGTLKGQKEAGTIAQFNEPVQNFAEMQAMIKKEVPAMFDNIAKFSPTSQFIPGGISGFQSADGSYGSSDQKRYLINIATEPKGAVLSFGGLPDPRCSKTPCKTELAEGDTRIFAVLDHYERADTMVSIKQNNQNINIKLKANFGVLEIRPAYLEGVGEHEDWNLSINGKAISSLKNNLSPGKYSVKLEHRCYEALIFDVGINKGKTESFNMQGRINVKEGGLNLSAEQDGEPVIKPVFVNGRHVGETPFIESVPVCSEVKVGNERVNVELKYKQTVKYTHKLPDSEERQRRMENERARRAKEKEEARKASEEAKKMEEEARLEEEETRKYEEGRTSWALSGSSLFGYGRFFYMNEIAPYFKSSGWQLSFLSNWEIYKRNIRFLRFGLDWGVSGIDIDRDALREIRNIPADTKINAVIRSNINVLAKLYPVKYLLLTGGVGWEGYNNLGTGNAGVAFSELVFPVGGGICVCDEDDKGYVSGFAIEARYNILPLKGSTAAYISVNFEYKGFEWNYVKRKKKSQIEPTVNKDNSSTAPSPVAAPAPRRR
jgi:hypothetical protein